MSPGSSFGEIRARVSILYSRREKPEPYGRFTSYVPFASPRLLMMNQNPFIKMRFAVRMTLAKSRHFCRRASMIGRFEALKSARGKRLRTLCFSLTIAAIALLSVLVAAIGYGFVFNCTHSAPFGLYKEIGSSPAIPHEPTPYAFFCPDNRWPFMRDQPNYRSPMWTCPDGYAPLIKPVVAWAGDTVQNSREGIAVNGHLIPNTLPIDHDSRGREIHPYPFGTYFVEPDHVWVVSSFSPRSFDSRYFGPIPIRCVRAWVRPFWVEKSHRLQLNDY